MNARRIARVLGRRGGRKRAMRLSSAERKRIASLGGVARATSLRAARRIVLNLRYAAAVQALARRPSNVTRLAHFEGPLPGIYTSKR